MAGCEGAFGCVWEKPAVLKAGKASAVNKMYESGLLMESIYMSPQAINDATINETAINSKTCQAVTLLIKFKMFQDKKRENQQDSEAR